MIKTIQSLFCDHTLESVLQHRAAHKNEYRPECLCTKCGKQFDLIVISYTMDSYMIEACNKIRYKSYEDAKEIIPHINAKARSKKHLKNAYYCKQCKAFHITSKK